MAKLIRISNCFKNISRYFSSSLYITGDKAQSNFVVLTPYIDFEDQIKNRPDIIKNIEARKLTIDLSKVEERWNFYKMMDDHKNILEITKSEILKMISKLKEDPNKNQGDIEKLVLHMKLVKDDLKNVKEYSYGVEESAALGVLGLPNVLHPQTPIDNELLVHQFLEKPTHYSDSHLVMGKTNNLVEYISPMFNFLKSDAALFEFAISNYFQSSLSDFNYIQFSNADFVRSIVVEGCGADYLDQCKTFTLEDHHSDKPTELNRLHLVGSASLYAFMAYFTKHSVQHAYFPLNFYNTGRKYQPVNETANNLFNVNQQSVVNVFVAIADDERVLDETLSNISQQIIKIYEPLGYHFRLVYIPADQLEISESLRLSIQMYSNHLKNYVEVGNVSAYENYLSKRLLLTYNENKQRKFPKIIAGDLLNIQKFLACALENNFVNKSPLLCDVLKNYL